MERMATVAREGLRTDIPKFRSRRYHPGHGAGARGRQGAPAGLRGPLHGQARRRVNETFRVRKVSAGVGVERVFPMHSPTIARSRWCARDEVRRAKLYYLRKVSGKAARIREKSEN